MSRIVHTVAVLAAVITAGAAAADPIAVSLVSRTGEDAMQAQSPVWAPANTEVPTLTYEVNDRSRRIYLRVATRSAEQWEVRDVPLVSAGTPGSFLLSDQWADRSVAWVDERGFFFTRTLDSRPQLYYFDVAPHKVPWAVDSVQDPAASPAGDELAVAVTDAEGTELVLVRPTDWEAVSPITASPGVVEHSPCWFSDGDRLLWAATDRDETQLWTARLDGTTVVERRILYATAEEILVPSCCPFSTLGLAAVYVRAAGGGHTLLVVDAAGRIHRKVDGVYVEPGRPAQPAWSPRGRYVVFVDEDAAAGNPVRAVDIATGQIVDIPLDLSGVLEVSVGRWLDAGISRTLLAVVAVGDGEGVRNHVYVADVTELLEER